MLRNGVKARVLIAAMAVGVPAFSEVRLATPMDIAGGTFEASGVAPVRGTNITLFVDDGRPSEVFALELHSDGEQRGDAVPVRFDASITDLEGLTTDGRFFYAVGSQSKLSGHDGDGLVKFSFDATRRSVSNVERITNLKGWLADNVPELEGTQRRLGDAVLNIEGLAWDPERDRFLLGLRAPLVGDTALVIPVRLSDPSAGFVRENLRLDSAAIRLDLGGAGIRSIEYDPFQRTFLLITGASLNEEDREFRVVEWNGVSSRPGREVARYRAALKPEGITTGVLDGKSVTMLVFDVGKFALMRRLGASQR